MKIMLEAELPFEECRRCRSFDPIVDKGAVVGDGKGGLDIKRYLTCKGYTFCKYLKENVLTERNENNG